MNCGQSFSCSSFYGSKNNATLNSFAVYFENEYYVNYGYNKIILPTAVNVPKGSIVMLNNKYYNYTETFYYSFYNKVTNYYTRYLYGLISIDTSDEALFSDYFVVPDTSIMYRLNNAKNYRIYLKVNIEEVFYQKTLEITHTYNQLGTYYLSAKIPSRNTSTSYVANLTNGKYKFF